ncbi:MAG: hypothetical protein WBD40_18415, partial [Tepidisphaeraceae bacterium]
MTACVAVLGTVLRPALAQDATAQTTPPPVATPEQAQPNQIAALLQVLLDPNPELPQPERDEAARRLVVMQTPDAKFALHRALVNTANLRGQQSAARALADEPNPDPDFIVALNALIGADAALTEAAARALAN